MKLKFLGILSLLIACVVSAPGAHAQATPYPNQCIGDTTTGTTINSLAKLTTSGTCIITATTDTAPAILIGVITAGAGKGGTQQVCFTGSCPLVMDGTATVGDCIIQSTTTAGQGHDTGSTTCTGAAFARVLNVGSAGAGTGTAYVYMLNVGGPQQTLTSTRRVCDIVVGDTSASALTNAQLGPQKRVCYIPAAATIVELDVAADAGTPNVIVGRNTAGTVVNITSAALATAASGGIACSNTGGTTGLDGATTCSSTLQNTSVAQGAYLELVSGTAGGTAKLMTIHIIYTVN